MLTETICPFCNKEFNPEIILDENQVSSCGCGAMLCLCLGGDEIDTMEEVAKEFPGSKIHIKHDMDILSDSPTGPPDSSVSALFWKAL